MDRIWEYVIGAIVGIVLFFSVAIIAAAAYTSSWEKDCNKLGATVVNDVAYKCERLPASPEPQK